MGDKGVASCGTVQQSGIVSARDDHHDEMEEEAIKLYMRAAASAIASTFRIGIMSLFCYSTYISSTW